jgi:hypothetical protein
MVPLFAGKTMLTPGELEKIDKDGYFFLPIDDQQPVVVDGWNTAFPLNPRYVMYLF